MNFQLNAVLARDTCEITRLTLCRVLLMNDKNYPWVILVPERADLAEIHDLVVEDQQLLMAEMSRVSTALKQLYQPDKINIGALGNIVSQLHVHIIARFESDAAWPGPVWGAGAAVPYEAHALAKVRADILAALS